MQNEFQEVTLAEARELAIQGIVDLVWATRSANKVFQTYSHVKDEDQRRSDFMSCERLALSIAEILFLGRQELREIYSAHIIALIAEESAFRLQAKRTAELESASTSGLATPIPSESPEPLTRKRGRPRKFLQD